MTPNPPVRKEENERSQTLQLRTFHHRRYQDIRKLLDWKNKRGLTISVCLPTLNEAPTVGMQVALLRKHLVEEYPLLDEIAVIDSGSTDQTERVARDAGAEFFLASDIFPHLPPCIGKGENLWKALQQLRGDLVCYLDSDIENFHPRFAYGLLGPLLEFERIDYVKAFYRRPLSLQGALYPTGGGRVTEILVRPLFSLICPRLTHFVQPLSGEYAGRRRLLETLPYPVGYGVETAHLYDILSKHDLSVFAQVDLDERVHRNRSNLELGRTSFVILQTLLQRLHQSGQLDLAGGIPEILRHFSTESSDLDLVEEHWLDIERPPIISIPDYWNYQSANPCKPARLKIISGGQTGVDRAGLDAALALGAPCGGWCPSGRRAEDDVIPVHYPLQEMDSSSYMARTIKNLMSADATLILYWNKPSGGTEQTLLACIENRRPYLLIDAQHLTVFQATPVVVQFVKDKALQSLNVAGPRASQKPQAYDYALQLVTRLLENISS